jgi:hypothetical protein
MSHILLRLGEAALLPRRISARRWLGPILSRRQALELRKEWLEKGRWAKQSRLPPGCGAALTAWLRRAQARMNCRCGAQTGAPRGRREWPYESLVPGIHTADPYRGGYQKGTKRERNREARCAHGCRVAPAGPVARRLLLLWSLRERRGRSSTRRPCCLQPCLACGPARARLNAGWVLFRQKDIEEKMAKMPQMIAEYRVSGRAARGALRWKGEGARGAAAGGGAAYGACAHHVARPALGPIRRAACCVLRALLTKPACRCPCAGGLAAKVGSCQPGGQAAADAPADKGKVPEKVCGSGLLLLGCGGPPRLSPQAGVGAAALPPLVLCS